jgi:hypothetical protein
LLEGKTVNLRVMEKEDSSLFNQWYNNPEFLGETLFPIQRSMMPSERGKGYCTEAAQLMVDYLFLSREIPRIQALTLVKNVASQRVLERVGFKKEGIMRKCFYIRGEWSDFAVFSILREEWKEPKILTRTAQQGSPFIHSMHALPVEEIKY